MNRVHDVAAFLNERANPTYSYEAHEPVDSRQFRKPVCKHCGLVFLNNDLTRWAVRVGCNHALHPEHDKRVKNARARER